MKLARKGFTLVEMLVVVLIIGILTTMGMPYYVKTVEASKASDALAVGHMLAMAHRLYIVDHPGAPLSGTINNTSCNLGKACDDASLAQQCRLIACNYVASQDWDRGAYDFTVGQSGMMASVRRKTTGATGTTKYPYSGWGYDFDQSGVCHEVGDKTPACPSF